MEEVEVGHEMPFEGRKVAEAAKEVIAQGPGAISRIMDSEVEPFIEDVQTLATSMANLYQEHAAHFILLGVRVNIEVQVMNKTTFKSQVGASAFDDNDINRVVHKEHEDAVTSAQ